MKTKFFNGKEVTNEQFLMLSLLAYEKRGLIHCENDLQRSNVWQRINAAEMACNLLKVPESLMYEIVINDNCKGLQNLNRLTFIDYWEY